VRGHHEGGEDRAERRRDQEDAEPPERYQRSGEWVDADDGPGEYVADGQEEPIEGQVRPMESGRFVEDSAEVHQERRPSEHAQRNDRVGHRTHQCRIVDQTNPVVRAGQAWW
jgi:hypothetical protein